MNPRRSETRDLYVDRIVRVLRHVQEHLDESLAPSDLARVAHFSAFHFHRIFRGMVGESIGEHIRRVRLEQAAGELRRTDRTVIDIALGAGYGSHESFTRAFKSHFGDPPAAYRASDEPLRFPPAPCGVHYGTDDALNRFTPIIKESPMLEVSIKNCSAIRVVAARHVGPYDGVGEAFERLCAYAFPRNLMGPATRMLGIYYDNPEETPAESLRSDACLAVPEGFEGEPADGIEVRTIEGGEYAVCLFKGPYTNLAEAYGWILGQWAPESGREPADLPCYECYLNNPQTTAPEDLLTEIHVPLVPAGERSKS
jgi:AraC family transcriptional regulator